MTSIELLASMAEGNLGFVKMTIADFSDADLLVRPCPGANHAAWQLGHLVSAESYFCDKIKPGFVPAPPEKFAGKFGKHDAGIDDPAYFPCKEELLSALARARAGTVKLIRSLTPADLEKPGPEQLRAFAPTVGDVLAMVPSHVLMHMGQIQVIRRKLGKPILF